MPSKRGSPVKFAPSAKTFYARALELAIQGKRDEDGALRFTNGDLDRVIPDAQGVGLAEGWYSPKKDSRPNAPDIPSAFAGRRKLPESIRALGYTAVRPVVRGTYELTKGLPSRIELPDVPSVEDVYEVRDTLPEAVRSLIPASEQGALARVGESGILRMFLGVQETYRIVAHWSTGGAEMDEVHTAVDARETVLVPVEAKSRGASEHLQRHQFTRGVAVLHERFPGVPVRPVGLKVIDDSTVMLVEFNETEDTERLAIQRVAMFRFVEALPHAVSQGQHTATHR